MSRSKLVVALHTAAFLIERGEHEENSNLSCMLSLVRTCLSTTTKEVANE